MHMIKRWDDIKVFNACMKYGSLSAAANALDIQQSTVSRRLAGLERSLGAPLFTRTSEGVLPTVLALKLQGNAEAMGQHLLALERDAAGHEPSPSGCVRLALIEPVSLYIILPHLDDLSERYPELRIDLVTSYRSSDLTRGEADLALRFVRPSSGDLVSKRVGRFPLVVAASQGYLDRHGPPGLAHGRWVSVTLPSILTPEERWYQANVLAPPWLQTSSYVTANEAIVQGYAVGLTTTIITRSKQSELVEVDLGVELPPALELWLVVHRSMRHVPRVDALWCWLSELFSGLIGGD